MTWGPGAYPGLASKAGPPDQGFEAPGGSQRLSEQSRGAALTGVRALLGWVGQDVDREGLVETPARVLKAFAEMTEGYDMDPAVILAKRFKEEHADEMVVLKDISFNSLCEHHLLPFTGSATVGYVPDEYVVGLSKLARVVECYARRLQVQERMTHQIAVAMRDNLDAKGVGVVVRAAHSCMGCRGIKKAGAQMVTSALLGVMRDKPEARAEFLALAR